jgi:hypothetical protein
MKRFYYSATRNLRDFDGVIRAPSIDSAREMLLKQGFEDISLSILTSSDPDLDSIGEPPQDLDDNTSPPLEC